ncbi:MAG: histidine phosphatase family protein [Geminicoccaceae bacterium]|nr:histidine phosphatase family protein [Geminicoccaceae bacterium]MCX8102579.1 histidine phosphatase family protein [Geminicoccaceae bacterium]MDW8371041.1 histidine phosphatase family protein [Geminicoccaceae bacterium]
MRELLLLRHAKSAWDVPGLDDHARDLAPRGKKAAKKMGALLAEKDLLPDLVLCSTAKRAVRTLELVAEQLPRPLEVRCLDALYLASEEAMLKLVRAQDDAVRRLMLVGHDPGFHRLALELVGAADAEAIRTGLVQKFPTGALAHLALPIAHWAEIAPGKARLVAFYKPRELD